MLSLFPPPQAESGTAVKHSVPPVKIANAQLVIFFLLIFLSSINNEIFFFFHSFCSDLVLVGIFQPRKLDIAVPVYLKKPGGVDIVLIHSFILAERNFITAEFDLDSGVRYFASLIAVRGC